MLLFLDGFDHYDTADVPQKYTVSGAPTTTATNARTGRCLSIAATEYVQKNIPTTISPAYPSIYIGVAVRVSALAASNIFLAAMYGASARQVYCRINTNGTIGVYNGSGTLLFTTTYALSTGVWYYIELGVTASSTGGVVNLSIDGTSRGTVTAVNTLDESLGPVLSLTNGVRLSSGSGTTLFDDLYITNAAGPSPHNTFLGVGRVETLLPSAEGATNDWTSSAGGNRNLDVDEQLVDDDTSYNYTAIAGNRQLYEFDNLTAPTQRVLGVAVCTSVASDDGGSHSIKLTARPNSTNHDGVAQSISAAFTMYTQPWGINPQTGALWTVAQVNSMQAGIKMES